MKLKKFIYISFIYIANLVLMASVIIPHHHHGDNVCINLLHCADESDLSHSECNKDDSHTEDTRNTCTLKFQTLAVPGHRSQSCCSCNAGADDHSHVSLEHSIVLYLLVFNFRLDDEKPKIGFVFDHQLDPASFFAHTRGLRAPPIA